MQVFSFFFLKVESGPLSDSQIGNICPPFPRNLPPATRTFPNQQRATAQGYWPTTSVPSGASFCYNGPGSSFTLGFALFPQELKTSVFSWPLWPCLPHVLPCLAKVKEYNIRCCFIVTRAKHLSIKRQSGWSGTIIFHNLLLTTSICCPQPWEKNNSIPAFLDETSLPFFSNFFVLHFLFLL